MKKFISAIMALVVIVNGNAQTYPEPEFINQLYGYDKASNSLTKLEKEISKPVSNTKLGGMGGSESGLAIEGERSPVRLSQASPYSFIYSTNKPSTANSSPGDSVMNAAGIDMSSFQMLSGDISQRITLYKIEAKKGKRKIIQFASGGMKLMGKGSRESAKYTFSVKNIRSGYYEIVPDKTLPQGEYAFTMFNFGSSNGESTLFAFGVD